MIRPRSPGKGNLPHSGTCETKSSSAFGCSSLLMDSGPSPRLAPLLLFGFCGESVADAVDCLNIGRSLRCRFDLLTDAAHIDIDAAWSDAAIIAPYTVEKLVAGKDHPRVRCKMV